MAGDNIYARWYSRRPENSWDGAGWADPGAGYATNGYEAPRRTVVHQSVIFFSFEHLLAGAIIGLAFGIAITAALVFFGIGQGNDRYGPATLLFAAASALLPPLVSVLLLRDKLRSRPEAGICGAITLTFALPVAVIAGSYVNASGDLCLNCCMLPFVGIVAGWLIGGFVGRRAWDVFRG